MQLLAKKILDIAKIKPMPPAFYKRRVASHLAGVDTSLTGAIDEIETLVFHYGQNAVEFDRLIKLKDAVAELQAVFNGEE